VAKFVAYVVSVPKRLEIDIFVYDSTKEVHVLMSDIQVSVCHCNQRYVHRQVTDLVTEIWNVKFTLLHSFPGVFWLGCIECMRCRLLLPMIAVSVCLSQMHRMTPTQLHCVESFSEAFAILLWPLV